MRFPILNTVFGVLLFSLHQFPSQAQGSPQFSTTISSKQPSGAPLPSGSKNATSTFKNPSGTGGASLGSTSSSSSPNSGPTTSSKPRGGVLSPSATTSQASPMLAMITSYSPDASSATATIDGVTGNTHIKTGDSSHKTADVPVLWNCFFCPPGGGLVLWGMTDPGIYPPPPDPPSPGWPTITVGSDNVPTPEPSDDSKTSNQKTTASTPSATAPTTIQTTNSALSSTAATATATASASATASAAVCKRDIVVKREITYHRITKRVEQTIAGTDPLRSALMNLQDPAQLDSATGIILNRLGDKAQQNTFIVGLRGKLNLNQGQSITVDGQILSNGDPWIIRWDYDPVKLTHVNAEFGKGKDNPTYAYTFSSSMESYGTNYMRDAVKSLTDKARLDVSQSHGTSTPQFLQGTTPAEALQNVVDAWKSVMLSNCPANGAPVPSSIDPNTS